MCSCDVRLVHADGVLELHRWHRMHVWDEHIRHVREIDLVLIEDLKKRLACTTDSNTAYSYLA